MNEVLRPGIDHDPVKPWNWGTLAGRTDPVEIVSYVDPEDDTVFVRMTPGDPTSAQWVPLRALAAFAPDRHEWFTRTRRPWPGDSTAFTFTDEVAGG